MLVWSYYLIGGALIAFAIIIWIIMIVQNITLDNLLKKIINKLKFLNRKNP